MWLDSITTDSAGNLYATGSFSGTLQYIGEDGVIPLDSSRGVDAFIYKFHNDGSFTWAASFGGPQTDYSHDIVSTTAGDLYLTGSIQGTADLAPGIGFSEVVSRGEADIFLTKIYGYELDITYPVPGVPLSPWPLGLFLAVLGAIRIHRGVSPR